MELDMYEDDPDKKDGDAKRPSRQANAAAANGEAGRAGISSRRSLADDARTASSQNGAKEQGASTIASVSQSTQASVAVQPSRKRKAASQQQVGVSSTTQSKKGSGTTQNSSSTRPDSNLLTFENCKARPENGRMLADDGTVLEANGNTTRDPQPTTPKGNFQQSRLTQHYRSCLPGVRATRRAILPGPHYGIRAQGK